MSNNLVHGDIYLIESSPSKQGQGLSTYLLKSEKSLIIDPGPTSAVQNVINGLKAEGVKQSDLYYVALSHIHLDHAGGSWKLLLGKEVVDGYGEVNGIKSDRILESEDMESLDTGDSVVEVIWTPGHSNHHQAFYIPEYKVLIIGDAGGLHDPETGKILPTSPPPFNPLKAIESLDRLIALEPEVVCYSHYGFTYKGVEKLREYKKQIELWSSVTEKGLTEKLDQKEIFNRIKEVDSMLDEDEKIEAGQITNLQGFIQYHEWVKRK
jgi:glyoxylase-like metal-dependent hydrolase (beta-lactamase superfamily II)